jgi:glutamate-1-semialdehyde 2,1-aminomutase
MSINILNEGYLTTKKFLKKGIGPYIFDEKNNKFIDLTSAGGTSLLGHNNKIFKKSIKEFLNNNFSNFSLPNEHAKNFGQNIKKIFPQFSKFIFCNSGAEANIKAIRIARAVTNKDKIINVSGSWHGSIDQFLFSKDKKGKMIKLSDGLEKEIENKLIYAPYNNLNETKKIIKKNKNSICCVIVEPIQGCIPSDEGISYIKSLSNYCDKEKIILILDEIITGLRTNCSSVQNNYQLVSDISTFGKVFGNSLPIGFIAITKKIEKKINKKRLKIFFGGTFSGNSLSTYVANKSLEYLIKNKNKIFKDLEKKSNKFCSILNKNIIKEKIDAKVIRFGSIIRIIFSKNTPKDRLQRDFFEKKNNSKRLKFINYLKKKKIYFPLNGIIFINISFSSKDLNYLINKITEGLKKYFL